MTPAIGRALESARCPPLHGTRQHFAKRLIGPTEIADTKDMLPTWIFQRGGEHLTLSCRETFRGVTLIVSGDGDLRSYSFHDFAALVQFEGQMAQFLTETGWSPAQLTIVPQLNLDHVPLPAAARSDAAAKRH